MARLLSFVVALVVWLPSLTARADTPPGKLDLLGPFHHEVAERSPDAPPAPVSAVVTAPADGAACQIDDDCPGAATCEKGRCEKHFTLGRHDAAGYTQAVPPVWYRFHDKSTHATTSIFFPIVFWRSTPDSSGGAVGPVYRYRDSRGWLGGLAPVLLLGHRDGRSHQIVPPIFWHFHDDNRHSDTTVLGPLFAHWRKDAGWDGGIAPLLFVGGRPHGGYFSLAGLYTMKKDEHGQTHVLGPIYGSRRDDGYDFGLAPFFHVGRRAETHLRWLVPPVYLHWDDQKAGHQFTMFGPLFRSRSDAGSTEGLFPIAWHWRRGTRETHLVLPLAAWSHDDAAHRSALWVGPYIRLRDEARGSSTHVLLPLGVKHDEKDYHVLVQFPFYWDVRSPHESGRVVFPLYLHVEQPDLSSRVVFPLFWRFRTPSSTTTVAAPLYWRSGKDRFDAGIAPLGGFGRGPHRRYGWFLPAIFWHSSDDEAHTSRTVLALFIHDKKPIDWTSSLFPLYFAWRRGPKAAFVGPLIYRGVDDAGHRSLSFVGPVYWGGDAHENKGGLFPLLFASRRDDGTWHTLLLPLFDVAKKQDGSRFITLAGGWSTTKKGVKGFVGPVYFRKDTDGYAASLIPLFYRGVDRAAGTTTTAVFPLYVRRTTPDHSLTGVTPFVWNYSTVLMSTTVGFPLFLDQHRYYDHRTTAFLPFFARHQDFAEHSNSWIFPLVYLKKGPLGTNYALFPLVWHFDSANGARTTIVAPLYWYIKRGPSTTRVFFPFYATAHREIADHLVILNFYYKKGINSFAGSYHWHIVPLFDFGRPSPGDVEWSIGEGLVGYSRIGRKRTLHLFYQLEVPLAPVGGGRSAGTTFFDAATPASRRTMD